MASASHSRRPTQRGLTFVLYSVPFCKQSHPSSHEPISILFNCQPAAVFVIPATAAAGDAWLADKGKYTGSIRSHRNLQTAATIALPRRQVGSSSAEEQEWWPQ